MNNILLLEDDLSLITGLSLVFRKQGLDWKLPERSKRRRIYGQMANMIYWFWMSRCLTVQDLNSAKESGRLPKCQLSF